MRKTLVFAVISALALLAPAAAQAHHLDQDTSSVTCTLTNNVPTVHVSAHYVDFSPWDQPVAWSASIDKVSVGGGMLTWVGPDFRHNVSFVTTAGSHDVVYQSSWNSGENGAYLSRRGLVCPAAVLPPVKPPPPTVVVVTPPPPPPPVVVPCPCPPRHPVVKPKCVCPRIHVIKPRHAVHGTHLFGGRITNNRHAKIIHVTITARAVGRGRPPCGGSRSATMQAHGRTIRISLYNLDFFRHCLAWGDYKLTMRFRVVFKQHGKIVGRKWCKRVVRFFDQDPFHPPS